MTYGKWLCKPKKPLSAAACQELWQISRAEVIKVTADAVERGQNPWCLRWSQTERARAIPSGWMPPRDRSPWYLQEKYKNLEAILTPTRTSSARKVYSSLLSINQVTGKLPGMALQPRKVQTSCLINPLLSSGEPLKQSPPPPYLCWFHFASFWGWGKGGWSKALDRGYPVDCSSLIARSLTKAQPVRWEQRGNSHEAKG